LSLKHDILATITYFDIFDYPITQSEISLFLKNTYPHKEFSDALYQLTIENWIFKFDEFYTLQENYSLVMRRRQGNTKAREMMKTAEKIASLLSAFPFVRGVAVSGSLSKNYADEKSDIDFFIITKKNYLWLSRTLLHCFKKITFLFKKEHWFCMNYFIDEDALQIKEKNIFTATELATLIPLRGISAFDKFYSSNKWSRSYLPNHTMRVSLEDEVRSPLIKKITEYIFSNMAGKMLGFLLMKYTSFRWSQKTKRKKLNNRGIVMGMDVSRHYAKPDPDQFQKKLIRTYEKKIFNLFLRYENKAKSIH
jgi:predicted nucleotidyltransferase